MINIVALILSWSGALYAILNINEYHTWHEIMPYVLIFFILGCINIPCIIYNNKHK